MLHYRAQRYAAALADLLRARELGADPAVVSLDLALVHLARGEQAAALDNLSRSLSHNPHQPDARQLHDSLRGRGPRRGPTPSQSSRTAAADESAPAPGQESR
jgi:hypothetical protein